MWQCKKCGEQLEDQFDSCWKCSASRYTANVDDTSISKKAEEQHKFRYPMLRLMSSLYGILAFLVAAGGVIGLIYGIANGSLLVIVVSIIWSLVGCLSLLSLAELIRLLLAIEENTRGEN